LLAFYSLHPANIQEALQSLRRSLAAEFFMPLSVLV
jgi:hypothetical protein